MNLTQLLQKSKTSKASLWLLNHVLWRMIPFNRPHRFSIAKVTDDSLEVLAPYKRKNLNHVKGIHACAIATIAEFSAGLMLLTNIDVRKYRLILAEIKLNYHYQAKNNIISRCRLEKETLKSIFDELSEHGICLKKIQTEIYDQSSNHIATADMTWQLKSWNQVKTTM